MILRRASPYLFAVAVLLFWTLFVHWQRIDGTEIEVPITGYDPRDLLSGHYVTYRLDLGESPVCENDGRRCLCFVPERGPATLQWYGACEERPADCAVRLEGTCEGRGNFVAGIERYYIPEADSPYLQTVPEASTILLSITKNGGARVKELRPAGLDYQAWIEMKKAESEP